MKPKTTKIKKPIIVTTKDTMSIKFADRLSVVKKENKKKISKMKEFIKKEDWKGLQEFLTPGKKIQDHTAGVFKVKDGKMMFGKDEIPKVIGERILELKKKRQDWKHLILFWKNLKQNPSDHSKSQLFGFLEANHFPFTTDGRFVAYKGVHDSGNGLVDCYTNKISNDPGKHPEMPREEVDPDPNNTCSVGLHVAAWQYVKTQYPGNTFVQVVVNPRDVVSVPTDYNGQKMRTCGYQVLKVYDKDEPVKSFLVDLKEKKKPVAKKNKAVAKKKMKKSSKK